MSTEPTCNTTIASVGVYLGSEMGKNPEFKKSVISFGTGLAKLGITLVYGGASTGLMGLLAETVKHHGGKVVGVITNHLINIEKPSSLLLDELHVVDSMYDRKRLIHEKSTRFIAMPGGLGTLDEVFETWCGIKIGVIKKPMGFINISGYFDPLFQLSNMCLRQGFLREVHVDIPKIYDSVQSCLQDLVND